LQIAIRIQAHKTNTGSYYVLAFDPNKDIGQYMVPIEDLQIGKSNPAHSFRK
jgi:hypothetical protein